jgi:hypothetical protein
MTFIIIVLDILFTLGAIQVARAARARRLPNLYWLAGNFAAGGLGGLIYQVTNNPLFSTIGLVVSALCMIMFIQRTFYRDLPSPYLVVLALVGAVGVWQIYTVITNPTYFSVLSQVGYLVVWFWQAFLAFRDRRKLVKNPLVEDWVKTRYLLWFLQTFIMGLMSARMLLMNLVPYSVIEWNIGSSLVILSGLAQYIVWVMPEAVRRFLNRNYKPVDIESPSTFMDLSEEEVMEQIKKSSG